MSRFIDKLYLNNSVLRGGSSLTFNKADNTFGVTVAAPSGLAANYTFTYPTSAGSANQVLVTNGSGVSSFVHGILQGGNTVGADLSVGASDNFGLFFKTNNVDRLRITAAGDAELRGDATNARSLLFEQKDNTAAVSVKAADTGVTSWTLQLPTTAGALNQTLKTDGAGVTSWVNTILQTGNAFGADVSLGATDAFGVKIKTNNVDRVNVTSTGNVQILGDNAAAKFLQFEQKDNAAAISLRAPNTGVTSYELIWPVAQAASSGHTLVNDGTGQLYWGMADPSDNVQYSSLELTASATLGIMNNLVEADASSADIVLTLPPVATSIGMHYFVYKTDSSANTVQIVPASGEKYNGVADNTTIKLTGQYDRTYVLCIHGGWWTF